VLVVVLIALCSSAFGILIAALAHTENQIGGLSTLLLWGMGLLGGSFIPLFLLERFLGPLPKIVPHYWATHALVNLMVRGLGWGDVALDMAVLLGFTALFFAVGLWRFDFD
jgi:ABC-2 type transport system permease protein